VNVLCSFVAGLKSFRLIVLPSAWASMRYHVSNWSILRLAGSLFLVFRLAGAVLGNCTLVRLGARCSMVCCTLGILTCRTVCLPG